MRMSTKDFCRDVRTYVEVGSEGGSGSHWMKARVEMLGGAVVAAGWLGRGGRLRLASMVCIFGMMYNLLLYSIESERFAIVGVLWKRTN
jgi:hypothetical protein